MFDRSRCFKTITDVNCFNEKEKELKNLEMKLKEKKNQIQEECKHDLILCYCIDFGVQIIRKGKCLICGKDFELVNNFDLLSNSYVNTKSILDVNVNNILDNTNEIDLNSFYLLAKDMLQLILSENKELSLEEVKMRIVNYLILKERDLEVKRLEKVKID